MSLALMLVLLVSFTAAPPSAKAASPAPVRVILDSGMLGYVDANGKEIAAGFLDGKPFANGLASVKKGRWGAIDPAGKVVVPFDYDAPLAFTKTGVATVKRKDRWGAIDRTGKVLFPFEFDKEFTFDDTGIATAFRKGAPLLLNSQGREVALLETEGLEDCNEGRCGFSQSTSRERAHGFFGPNGEVAIAPTWGNTSRFVDGLAAVRSRDTASPATYSKWGMIDLTGKVVLKPTWDSLHVERGGRANVKKGDQWVLIDRSGREVKPAKVEPPRWNDKGAFVDAKGKELAPGPYTQVEQYEGLFGGTVGDEFHLLSDKGKVLWKSRVPLQKRTIEKVMAAEKTKNFEAALADLETLISLGMGDAAVRAATYFENGLLAGGKMSALPYLKKAAEAGNPIGMATWADALDSGAPAQNGMVAGEKDVDAGEYLRRAAEYSVPTALLKLGLRETDPARAIALLRSVCEQAVWNSPATCGSARVQLADRAFRETKLMTAKGGEKGRAEGVAILTEAIKAGSSEAAARLGAVLLDGQYGVQKDEAQGLRLLDAAARADSVDAQRELGRVHLQGLGGSPRDASKALYWYERAEQAGDAVSAAEAAKLRAQGIKVDGGSGAAPLKVDGGKGATSP